MSAVTYAYLNPKEDTADKGKHVQLKLITENFGMTSIKVRKILITSGAYQTATSIKVNNLYRSGKRIKEIQAATGLSPAFISGYLPYAPSLTGVRLSADIGVFTPAYQQVLKRSLRLLRT